MEAKDGELLMPAEKGPGISDRAGVFRRLSGGGEEFYSFHPKALPPTPPLRIDADAQELLDLANQALGRLDGITLLLPDPDQFLYAYIRKEAVLSSQIEGTQSSLSDLLLFEHDEAPGVPVADTRETFNYIRAMNHGIARMRDGFPLSLRLFKEMHASAARIRPGRRRAPGDSAPRRTGSAAPAPATPATCRLPRTRCCRRWARWRSSSTTIRSRHRC